jgi:pyruvate kinase
VRNAQDILDLRAILDEEAASKNISQNPAIKIIAKIERREAVENIESIMQVVDAIMVARGDLGLEIPGEQVPVIQKQLTMMGIAYNKPVIVATQMLDSMEQSPRATRAEVSDVANAVIDHTAAVMLSNESAVGKYPVETVQSMARILLETENSKYDNLPLEVHAGKSDDLKKNMEELGKLLSEKVTAAGLVLWGFDEHQARVMSSFRPELSIFVPVENERILHQLNLSWGLVPILFSGDSLDTFLTQVKIYLQKNALHAEEVIIVSPHSLEVRLLG